MRGTKIIKQLPELLSTVNEALPFITLTVPSLTPASKLSEVKKEYQRIVRIVHPDKLAAEYSFEQKLHAEAVFVVLADAYETFKNIYNL